MTADSLIITCLMLAWLLPLAGCVVISVLRLKLSRLSAVPGWIGTGSLLVAFCLSLISAGVWLMTSPAETAAFQASSVSDVAAHETGNLLQRRLVGHWYSLAKFGEIDFPLGYAIDALTVLMFVLVTMISLAVHAYSLVYMADEQTESYQDHHLDHSAGETSERPGRFAHFYAALGLFTFAMLGIVLAHGLLQIFVFWELVGFSSYLLIGFYHERRTARLASMKAFLMNRVGDVGFVLGMTILLATCGTLLLYPVHDLNGTTASSVPMALPEAFQAAVEKAVPSQAIHDQSNLIATEQGISYALLVAAGLGLLAGCVGKSAQFPLHPWLADAMEGPTPVSALVHSATMVAAGVYLAARIAPLLLPEALLLLAYVGVVTLLLGASMAIVARDLKLVLAHSTISQLGLMLLGIGVGAWEAAIFHLITHAFFKSLLFLGAGSVIHTTHHEQDLEKLGGLRAHLPLTSLTMLIGVIALSGLAIPYVTIFGESLGFSGFHSKDAIVSGTMAFVLKNPHHILLLISVLLGACLTAAYSLRLWFKLFARDTPVDPALQQVQEGPWLMTWPLVVLAFFAAFCALGGEEGFVSTLVEESLSPAPAWFSDSTGEVVSIQWTNASDRHAVHGTAGAMALAAAWLGALIAWALYGLRAISSKDLSHQLTPLVRLASHRWYFDTLYRGFLVLPILNLARHTAWIDRILIDPLIDGCARLSERVSHASQWFDEAMINRFFDNMASSVWASGLSLRKAQTGHIRQYVLLATMAVIVLFLILFAWMPGDRAGR